MVVEYACFLREMENWGSDLQSQVEKGLFFVPHTRNGLFPPL